MVFFWITRKGCDDERSSSASTSYSVPSPYAQQTFSTPSPQYVPTPSPQYFQLRLRNMVHLFMYFRPKILLRLHLRLRSIYISQTKIYICKTRLYCTSQQKRKKISHKKGKYMFYHKKLLCLLK